MYLAYGEDRIFPGLTVAVAPAAEAAAAAEADIVLGSLLLLRAALSVHPMFTNVRPENKKKNTVLYEMLRSLGEWFKLSHFC